MNEWGLSAKMFMMYLIRTAWYLINDHMVYHTWGFPGGSAVKNLPAMQETRVWSLGQEDPLEKEMTTSAVFLPRESHGHRSLKGYSPQGYKELGTTKVTEQAHVRIKLKHA